MADLMGFDANEVEPSVGFDPLPAGDYVVILTGSDWKDTRSGTGRYLEIAHEVVEGQYRGRRLWARLNLENQNEKAVEIAKAQLSSICRAVDVRQPRDSAELHGIPLVATVKIKKRQDTGDLVNEISGWKAKPALMETAVEHGGDGKPSWMS